MYTWDGRKNINLVYATVYGKINSLNQEASQLHNIEN